MTRTHPSPTRKRAPRTPAALWQRWAAGARPPFLAWGLLPGLWGLWTWAAMRGHLAAWFVGTWAFPFHFWVLQSGWAMWRRTTAEAFRRGSQTLLVALLTLGMAALAGRLLPEPHTTPWVQSLPWNLLLMWGMAWLMVLLLPWWWEALPLAGVLWTWGILGPFWLAGLLLAGGQLLPGLTAFFNGLAGLLGTWGLYLLALGWVRIAPQSPFRRGWAGLLVLLAVLSAGASLGIQQWGPGSLSQTGPVSSAKTATPTPTSVPKTPTTTPLPVEILPAPPTATPTPTLTWTPSPRPSPTWTLTPTPSPTVPTPTPPPPSPTPMLAFVQAPEPYGGAFLRQAPSPDAPAIVSLLNGTRVWVLEPERIVEGLRWAHVRTIDGLYEGWILQSLLVTATPPPRW